MEALHFLKFWKIKETIKPSTSNIDTTEVNSITTDSSDYDDDDTEEESFFELEFTVPDYDTNTHVFDFKENEPQKDLSKRKILPIVTALSEPQSPTITPVKASPRFRIFMFKKSKSMPTELKQSCCNKLSVDAEKPKLRENNKRGASSVPILKRDNSLRNHLANDPCNGSSKRFSKEVIQRYLSFKNPLNIKVSKQNDNTRFSGELFIPSLSSSPISLGCLSPKKDKQGSIKHLGKSESSPAAFKASPPVVRWREDSLEVQNDGIQSAILHCKNSFNSRAKDSSLLSRFASESLQEK